MTARPPGQGRDWTDAELLDILERREKGFTVQQIANRYGVSKNTLSGLFYRMKAEPSPHDGTMPPRWYREGLAKREG